ncbi:MAG: type II secretion system protein GspG [Planctomycetes bacterium]|nr:type II secretion system protein GspG [Planctomycetota bacterium]
MKTSQPRPAAAGFTLVEIMVVIVILGLLAGLVIPNVIGYTDEARVETTRTTLVTVHGQIAIYVAKNGKIPEWEDLTAPGPSGSPILEGGTPKDAWGNEILIIRLEGRNRFALRSKGPDGIEDTDDDQTHPAQQQD